VVATGENDDGKSEEAIRFALRRFGDETGDEIRKEADGDRVSGDAIMPVDLLLSLEAGAGGLEGSVRFRAATETRLAAAAAASDGAVTETETEAEEAAAALALVLAASLINRETGEGEGEDVETRISPCSDRLPSQAAMRSSRGCILGGTLLAEDSRTSRAVRRDTRLPSSATLRR
jgi:hypothetical protein